MNRAFFACVLFAFGLFACTVHDGRDGDPTPATTQPPPATTSPPAPATPEVGGGEPSASDDGVGSSGAAPTSSSGGSGGSGVCEPNAPCGGLATCQDTSYGEKKCYLSCTCSDGDPSKGTLRCSLTC